MTSQSTDLLHLLKKQAVETTLALELVPLRDVLLETNGIKQGVTPSQFFNKPSKVVKYFNKSLNGMRGGSILEGMVCVRPRHIKFLKH